MRKNQPPALQRQPFLMAAFEDTEGTIRATDNKASIALIIHGFIFASLVGVLSRLGANFEQASPCFRALVIVLTSLMAIVFLGSITQLLRCVRPSPISGMSDTPPRGIFYLSATTNRWTGTSSGMMNFNELRDRVDALTDVDIDAELTAELLKVSAIRARKVALARSGFELLGAEVALAVALLGSLAIHQL